jgi:hypothetical protein
MGSIFMLSARESGGELRIQEAAHAFIRFEEAIVQTYFGPA